jgi:hypothetical protein
MKKERKDTSAATPRTPEKKVMEKWDANLKKY